jgi:hypothetical protein
LIKSLVSKGELANPVGIPMPLFNSNCNEYNLSRIVIAAAELRHTLTLQTVLLRHSQNVILGLIRGIIASN